MKDRNRINLTGRLTRDPEQRESFLAFRLAFNGARKQADEWVDVPNYVDVDCKANNFLRDRLVKGAAVDIEGELRWREWENAGGGKQQRVSIFATDIRFLAGKSTPESELGATVESEIPNGSAPF
jgi:single-stranded DNA-binding protein